MKNLITYLKALWSRVSGLESTVVSLDCRLTVGSPSFHRRSTMLKLVSVLVLVLTIGVGNVWGTTYTYTPGGTYTASGGTSTISGVQWTYSSATYCSLNSSKIQIGSKNNPQTSNWTIQTAISNFGSGKKVTAISLTAYTTATTATYDISAGGASVKSGSLTTSSNTYTASSLNVTSGNIVITMKGSNSSKAMYLCGISVTYEDAGGGCDKTVTLSYDGDGASHGEFVLKAGSASGSTISEGGTVANCGSGTTVVALCPQNVDAHWHLEASNITATNKTGSITSDGNGNFLISYTQGGNVSSSVSVTFTEDTKYTVTWMSNGSQHTTTQVYSGEKPTLPSNPSSCDATSDTFYGWSTAEWTGALDDVSAKTIYTDASAMPAVTGAVTYYAVFAKAVKSDNFQLLTDANNFISGEDYLIESYYSYTDHVLKAANYSGQSYQQTSENSWSLPSSGVNFDMSSKSALCIWKITSEGNNRFSIYNASANKYLVLVTVSTYDNLILSATKDASFVRTIVEEEGYADTYKFESSAVSGKHLYCEGAYWDAYTSAEEVNLYKRVTTYSKYLTNCCTELGSINGSVSLTQGGNSVTISGWDDVSNASKYTAKIYAADDLSSAVQTIENIATGSKSATFTGLTLNSDYVFSVTAIGNGSTYCDGDETFVDEINEIDVSSTPFKLSYSIYMDNGSGSGWTDHLLEDDGTYTATLGAGISYYQFGIRRGFDHGGWWAATLADNVYDTGDEEWTLNGSNNVRLQTFVGGSYIFTVDLSGANPKITITYPPANQAAGKIVYWDASIHGNNWTKLIFRVGTNASSNAGADCKTDGQLVPGTDNFYKVTTAEYNNMRAWAIANNAGWTGTQTNGVYRTNDFDGYNVTKSTQYQDYVVGNDGVTLIPSSSGTIGDKSYNNNCYFYPVTKTDGMLTHNVAVAAKPTGGSITVTYTNTSGIGGQTVTDGNNADLAHRCILNVVATPETGYNLATFTKNASAFAGGNYILTEDVAFAATFSLKQTTVNLNNHEATTAGAASVTATYSQAVPSIATNLPAKTGYIFGGYWTGENGTGTKYINADGTSANNWSIVDATTTLHAQWTPKRCTVTLTAGTGSNGSAVFDYDATTYVSFSPAVRVGWTCTGYWTNTGGTGTKVLNADGSFAASTVGGYVTSDKWSLDNTSLTLYAGWKNTYGGDEFELVLDLSELSAGKKIIILDKDYAYALGTSGSNNRSSVAAGAADNAGFSMSGDYNVVTLASATAVQVITLESSGASNRYYLNVENGYLYANGTSSNNYLKTRANNATNAEQGQFLFGLTDGDFTIRAQSGDSYNTYLREYSTSTFSCYSSASSNKAVLVYVKRESCDDPANALSVSASPTAISTATGFNTSTLSTTGGNGGTVYYRVISSNKANATIDGTTFSATTAGTYTVQAYQLKNENICRQISTVDIIVTTPILTTSKSSHAFEKTATGNSRNTNTITISGSNLVGNVSVALSGANADQFSISTTSVTAASAMESAQAITVTYSPTTAGAHTATITFSSTGAVDKTVTVTGTAADYYTVTWHISGSSNQTSQVESGTKPTFPSDPASCDATSTTFIGWATAPWAGKIASVSDKTIHTSNATMSPVTAATDYYAVWAKETSSVTDQTASFGFEEASPSAWTISNISQYASAHASGSYSGKCNANGNGNIITPNTIQYNTKLTTPTSISFKTARTGNTNAGNYWQVQSSSDGSIWSNVTDGAGPNHSQIASTNTFTDPFEVDLSDLSNVYIRINHNGSSPATLLDDIVLSYKAGSTTYSDYLTTCCENTGLTFGTILSPVTSYEIVRTSSAAATIDCNFESSTATEIKWYKTSRAARTFVTPTGATSSTAPSSQLAEMTIDIGNKRLTASSVGVYTITIKQDEATIAGQKYCESFAEVTVTVKVRDRFVDMMNGEAVDADDGNPTITKDDTGGGIYTPTESEFDANDICKSTRRKLIGWIKESDLNTGYAGRVNDITDMKTDNPATNKVIAPNTQVVATGCTWYAVWADID